jgi:hypothetical protein
MAGYSRDFLISAFLSRYTQCQLITIEQLERLEQMAIDLYDRVGRDGFRTYASLDAEAIRVYKNSLA